MQSPTVQLSFPLKLQPASQLVQSANDAIVPPVFAFAHVFTIQLVVDVAAVIFPHLFVPLTPLKAVH